MNKIGRTILGYRKGRAKCYSKFGIRVIFNKGLNKRKDICYEESQGIFEEIGQIVCARS